METRDRLEDGFFVTTIHVGEYHESEYKTTTN